MLIYDEIERLPPNMQKSYYRRMWSDGSEGVRKPCEVCLREGTRYFKPTAVTITWFPYIYWDVDYKNGEVIRTEQVVEQGTPVCENHIPERQSAVLALLAHRGKHHDNWLFMIHWYWRWFYSLKALICILLNRLPNDNYRERNYTDEMTGMAMWNWYENGGEYGGYSWTELIVGYGVFKGWYYRITTDSSV